VRRIGLVLLAIGLAGFLFASARKSHYETGAASATAASRAAETVLRWEAARWLLVGVGVIGVVFTVLPGKQA